MDTFRSWINMTSSTDDVGRGFLYWDLSKVHRDYMPPPPYCWHRTMAAPETPGPPTADIAPVLWRHLSHRDPLRLTSHQYHGGTWATGTPYGWHRTSTMAAPEPPGPPTADIALAPWRHLSHRDPLRLTSHQHHGGIWATGTPYGWHLTSTIAAPEPPGPPTADIALAPWRHLSHRDPLRLTSHQHHGGIWATGTPYGWHLTSTMAAPEPPGPPTADIAPAPWRHLSHWYPLRLTSHQHHCGTWATGTPYGWHRTSTMAAPEPPGPPTADIAPAPWRHLSHWYPLRLTSHQHHGGTWATGTPYGWHRTSTMAAPEPPGPPMADIAPAPWWHLSHWYPLRLTSHQYHGGTWATATPYGRHRTMATPEPPGPPTADIAPWWHLSHRDPYGWHRTSTMYIYHAVVIVFKLEK